MKYACVQRYGNGLSFAMHCKTHDTDGTPRHTYCNVPASILHSKCCIYETTAHSMINHATSAKPRFSESVTTQDCVKLSKLENYTNSALIPSMENTKTYSLLHANACPQLRPLESTFRTEVVQVSSKLMSN